jgi:CHAD domain-containing protein
MPSGNHLRKTVFGSIGGATSPKEPKVTELERTHAPLPAPSPLRPAEGFRLGVGEPLALGMRRIVLEQIDRSTDLLRHEPDLDRCVHELRKALKRVRAVLRLMRGELGRFRYRQENVVIRDTARRWSPLREAAVTAGVASDLTDDTELFGELLGRRLVAMLDARADALRTDIGTDRQLRTDTVTTLLAFRSRVARFPVVGDGAFPDRFSSVRPGLVRIARRAAADMAVAEARPTAHLLHEWRKDVKYLRHHMEVVQPVWEELFGAVAVRLQALGDVLGDEHDLATLEALVDTQPDLVPDERWRHRVLGAVEERRRRLQVEAFSLGHTVLGAPDDLVDRVEAAWEHARA